MSDPQIIQKRQGAYLPHWRQDHAAYFITFRLAGSLPSFLKEKREWARKEILSNAERASRPLTHSELDELEELHFQELGHRRFDQGADFLKDPRIAQIVADAFMHFQGARYRIFAWCIMPNHAHIVFQPSPEWDISDILHSWKRFSAREANKILGRKGSFWQPEYYESLG